MLCRLRIELHSGPSGLPQTLIPRETLADWAQANQLLVRANAQAEALLRQAEEHCEALREKAGLEFWQRADAQLTRWERERQAMCDSLEQHATSIANQAIRSLLDDTVAPKRLEALLQQLLTSQVPKIKAVLLCHPPEIEEVRQHLVNHGVTLWTLHGDDTLSPQTLVLKTDEGDFRISWSAMLESFFNNNGH
ncbi:MULTISPECIES: type III secretion system stator protein SctL [unclassified Pseudomonas]|uniref:type III secretion system stator protein SctL n=1 Tax=unclassified Pseudomonas TaxID=196821 RepID=UPI0015A39C73|nr:MULTISPECIES: type III secretion system stator protein SctL [unclassified Pseudomonas]NWC93854.1 type III secretion system stator protein SctL [Pseudomonas sp. IPO3779]NWD16172.1 type III secretion system stator protein SctL [Pseudomonas sp. IPO3778]